MGFRITDSKGFQITFANGYTASVQFGYLNFCDNRYKLERTTRDLTSNTAEVLVWDANDNDIVLDASNNVIITESNACLAYQTPDDVAALLARVAALPPSIKGA